MSITKEQLIQDIQGMERAHNDFLMELQRVTKAVEQQSGGIQYARMLLAKIEKEENEKIEAEKKANLNHVPQEEVPV